MLTMLDYSEAVSARAMLDPCQALRRMLGIDINIRAHDRAAIEAHPMSHRIHMIEGSSIASDVIQQVYQTANEYERVLIFLIRITHTSTY